MILQKMFMMTKRGTIPQGQSQGEWGADFLRLDSGAREIV